MNEEVGQEQPYPFPPQMSMSGHNTEGSLIYQTEYREIIDKIIHTLKCEQPIQQKDGSTIWQTPKNVKPLINDAGVYHIINIIEPRLSKAFQLGILTEDEVRAMTISVAGNIIDSLEENFDTFGVRDFEAGRLIVNLVVDIVFVQLTKAQDGKFLEYLGTVQNVQELNTRNLTPRNSDVSNGDRIKAFLFGGKR